MLDLKKMQSRRKRFVLLEKAVIRQAGDIQETPDGKLLVAVLMQAIQDVMFPFTPGLTSTDRASARRYIKDPHSPCYAFTDLTKEYVLELMEKALLEGEIDMRWAS